MRILKVAFAGLITALAMFFSLMVAFIVALIGVLVYLYLRLRGRTRSRPPGPTSAGPASRPAGSDVIDVTATEVRSERLEK
jgi:hypothetical protein